MLGTMLWRALGSHDHTPMPMVRRNIHPPFGCDACEAEVRRHLKDRVPAQWAHREGAWLWRNHTTTDRWWVHEEGNRSGCRGERSPYVGAWIGLWVHRVSILLPSFVNKSPKIANTGTALPRLHILLERRKKKILHLNRNLARRITPRS